MAQKRFSEEDVLNLLRQIEVELSGDCDVARACRKVGISDANYYTWRKKYVGMGRPQFREIKDLEKENTRLKKIVADLELDKLIMKETLDYL
jgi:transposase-like protein